MLFGNDSRAGDATATTDEPVKNLDASGMCATTEEIDRCVMLTTEINSSSHEAIERTLHAWAASPTEFMNVRHTILRYINGLSLELVYYRHDTNTLVIFPIVVGEVVEDGVCAHAE